jgi:outer membrane murein-binding lipoprotein Lpp
MANYDIAVADIRGLENGLVDVANSVGTMAKSVNAVTGYVSTVNEKVNNVSSEVSSLSEKMENFMKSIQGTTAVTNAKQSIVLSNQELDKKFRYYDDVRRQVTGLLQSVDLAVVRRETITKIAEEVVLKTPNYWLGRCFVALTAWINDQKDIADKALNDAMRLNDEDTSLFFFLVNVRINRNKPALIWLNRYLSMQDPNHLNMNIINVMNSMISGIYGLDAKTLLLDYLEKWKRELDSLAGVNEDNEATWHNFINMFGNSIDVEEDYYSYLQSSKSWPLIRNKLRRAELYNSLLRVFKNMFDQKEQNIPDHIYEADIMLNDLITNYDKDEYEIRKEIIKNKLIIEENGDLDRAYKRLEQEAKGYEGNKNLYQYLSDISINPSKYNCLLTTRKFAISESKNTILKVLSETNKEEAEPDIKFEILGWEGITKDGSNDKQLRAAMFNHVDSKYHDEVYQDKYLSMKSIMGLTIVLIGVICGIVLNPIAFLASLVGLVICGVDWKTVYDNRSTKLKQIKELKKMMNIMLNNTIAQVIDYKKAIDEGNKSYNELKTFLESLNSNQFILRTNDDTERKVILNGEINE